MKIMKTLLLSILFAFPLGLSAQTPVKPTLTINNVCNIDTLREITKKLIDDDSQIAVNKELTNQISLVDSELSDTQQQFTSERGMLLEEKKMRLSSMEELQQYRTIVRPLFVKIISLGIVQNKHDKLLDSEVTSLQQEINNWK